jgi:hypothetical protein
MSLRNNVQSNACIDDTGAFDDIFDKNAATTGGVIIAGGTAAFGAGVLLAALPAQMLVPSAVAGALFFVGDRQDKNLPLNPFTKDEDSVKPQTAADQGLGVAVGSGLDASKLPAVATA